MSKELSPKRRRFCEEYMLDSDAAKAARRAGYAPKNADVQGTRLMQQPAVKAYLEELNLASQRRTGITVDKVRIELSRLAFCDMKDFTRWGQDGVRLKSSDEVDGAVVRKVIEHRVVTTDKDGNTKETIRVDFELHDKVKCLELLGKELGMFKDRGEGEDPSGGGVNVNLNFIDRETREWAEKLVDAGRERRDAKRRLGTD